MSTPKSNTKSTQNTILKKSTKIGLYGLLFIALLLGVNLTSLFFLRNNVNVQNTIISYLTEQTISTNGLFRIEPGLKSITFTFDGYQIIDQTTDQKRLMIEKATLDVPYLSISDPSKWNSFSIKNAKIMIGETLHPISISSAELKANHLEINGSSNGKMLKASYKNNKLSTSIADKMNVTLEPVNSSEDRYALSASLNQDVTKAVVDLSNNTFTLEAPNKEKLEISYHVNDDQTLINFKSNKVTIGDWQKEVNKGQEIAAIIQDTFIKQTPKNNDEAHIEDEDGAENHITISFKKVLLNKDEIGSLRGTVIDTPQMLKIDFSRSEILEGTLTNKLSFPKNKAVKKDVSLTLKDFNYTKLLRAIGQSNAENVKQQGRATLDFNASVSGGNVNDWLQSAKGTLTLQGNGASFNGRLLNIWGGGLVNSLIPSFGEQEETNLKCFVINSTLNDGTMRIAPLALDTERVLIFGKGNINLINAKIDLLLKTKSKQIALGTIASDIRISGPLSSPSIAPDTLGALKKVGGLALGTVMPAFYIFTLTDIGITQDNPCSLDKKQ